MSAYQPRLLDATLDTLLPTLPAVCVEGARGVGKTATLARRAGARWELDRPEQFTAVKADPDLVHLGERPVFIDEWQRVPSVWDSVRRAVDQHPGHGGQFLLAGSTVPINAPFHSGAGRVVTLTMRPLSLAERQLDAPTASLGQLLSGARAPISGRTAVALTDYIEEILASGLPGIRPLPDRARRAQLDAYLRQVMERDWDNASGRPREVALFRRWATAYAAATATVCTFEKIRDAAGEQSEPPSRLTATRYRDALERLWLLDAVPGWIPGRNQLRRVGAMPKHYLVDPAFSARLLGVNREGLLRDGPLLGRMFESLVVLSVRSYAEVNEARISHLRTHDGRREVDLIVERDDGCILAIEVKLGQSVSDDDVAGLHWLRDTLGEIVADTVVINTGSLAYRRPDGIAVVPAALLGV